MKEVKRRMQKSKWKTLLERVASFCDRFDLFQTDHSLVVGVSGGSDSVFLVRALRERFPQMDLIVAHVNYRCRGNESDDEEVFVRALAEELRCFFEVTHPAKNMAGNFQETARKVRYAFFHCVAKQYGASGIAVGHTAEDQCETMLMHLLRGAGRRGLSGMKPRNGMTLRPLLVTSREEIISALLERGFPYRSDSSNAVNCYQRNFLRNRCFPLLHEIAPPGWIERFAEASILMASEEEWMDEQAFAVYTKRIKLLERGDRVMNIEEITLLPKALRHRLWRRALESVVDARSRASLKQIEAVDQLALRPQMGGKTIMLPGDVRVKRMKKNLLWWKERRDPSPVAQDDKERMAQDDDRPTHK